ncbi:MAG: TIGR00304 family protein [Methanobacterium sp. ERen5]|nr:MAG: TIGR00304 family protein [Methanobacterium sp. ERen5]
MVNSNLLILTGFGVVMLGIVMIFLGTLLQSSSDNQLNSDGSNTNIQTGGVIMIGPIPIIFGNNKGMVGVSVAFAIVLMVIYFLLFYRGRIF